MTKTQTQTQHRTPDMSPRNTPQAAQHNTCNKQKIKHARYFSDIQKILKVCWSPRVRRRPLSEISLWSTGSPMSWRVSQTPECSGLLTATRGFCVIDPQRQPGKFKNKRRCAHHSSTLTSGVRSGRGCRRAPMT